MLGFQNVATFCCLVHTVSSAGGKRVVKMDLYASAVSTTSCYPKTYFSPQSASFKRSSGVLRVNQECIGFKNNNDDMVY